MDRLFVYGTLQPKGPNAHVLEPLGGTWQPGYVKGKLIQQGWGAAQGYPALVLRTGAQRIYGQLLESDVLKDFWDHLDHFEGDEYERVATNLFLLDGTEREAWVYALRRTGPS